MYQTNPQIYHLSNTSKKFFSTAYGSTKIPPECEGNHRGLQDHGLCCQEILQQGIDEKLIKIYGCKIGVWIEPDGYRDWLNVAYTRLAEIIDGKDQFDWTIAPLADLHGWIWNSDQETRPDFSLWGFKKKCCEHHYTPNFKLVAQAYDEFFTTAEDAKKYWSLRKE